MAAFLDQIFDHVNGLLIRKTDFDSFCNKTHFRQDGILVWKTGFASFLKWLKLEKTQFKLLTHVLSIIWLHWNNYISAFGTDFSDLRDFPDFPNFPVFFLKIWSYRNLASYFWSFSFFGASSFFNQDQCSFFDVERNFLIFDVNYGFRNIILAIKLNTVC